MAIEKDAIVIIDGKRWRVADIWPGDQVQLYRRENGKDRLKYLPMEKLTEIINDKRN